MQETRLLLGGNEMDAEKTKCGCCKKAVSTSEWQDLPLKGHQRIEADEEGPAVLLEMRNHNCGSTLAVEVAQ